MKIARMSQRLADEDFVSPSRDLGISSDREEERSIQPALDGDAGGLFGSEEEVEGSAYVIQVFISRLLFVSVRFRSRKSDLKRRNTPDEEPPSGDDEDQRAFQDDSENEETQERARTILDAGIGRHAIPKPSYGDVCQNAGNSFLVDLHGKYNFSFIFFNFRTPLELILGDSTMPTFSPLQPIIIP